MKIAILTLQLHSNYGGVIQNYALQKVLKRMGHEAYTINFNPRRKVNKFKLVLSAIRRTIMKLIGHRSGIIFLEKKIAKDKLIIQQHVRRFINERINMTQPLYTKKDLEAINNMGFDAVIVGSDQVWRTRYAHPDIETYFLDFITNRNIKKLAFSASFGVDDMKLSKKAYRKMRQTHQGF